VCDIREAGDLAVGLILGCQARPVSDDVHIAY
jgi:ferredoxin